MKAYPLHTIRQKRTANVNFSFITLAVRFYLSIAFINLSSDPTTVLSALASPSRSFLP